jgi:uroporphyrinogen decarboxylase
MLPKERIVAALHHREPDRVPVGEIGVDYTVTEQALGHPTLYRAKWKEYQALWQGRREDYVESCKRDLVALARKFEWDFVPVFLVPPRNAPARPPRFLDTYTWQEPDGRIMQFSPESEGHAVCIQYPPLSQDVLVEQPVHIDPSQLELVEHVVRELGATHFILGRGEDGSFPHERYGLTELLVGMIDSPALVHRAINIETRKAIAINEALLDAGCDAVLPGDDYCSAKGPMMSPTHWKTFIFPALRALVESAHHKGKYLIKHTDGKTWAILDMLFEAGIDGWHGIQPKAGMDLALLKERYGERACFWGGVDVDVLVEGTPAEVRAATSYAIDSAARGGGFVLTSGNTLMVGVRYENYLAMLDAARAHA